MTQLWDPGTGTLSIMSPFVLPLVTFPTNDELKLGWHQSVQADVDGSETCFLELRQQPGQVDAIGGDADGTKPFQLMQLGCRERSEVSCSFTGRQKQGSS